MPPKLRLLNIYDHISEAADKGDFKKVKALSELGKRILEGEDTYLELCSTDPSANVREICEKANTVDWAKLYDEGKTQQSQLDGRMCAGVHESIVLQTFASSLKAKRVLEIGMLVGSTTLALAEVKSVENVVTLEIEPYLEIIAKPYWEKANVAHKIRPIFGPAMESLTQLAHEKQQFDIIFIDANKDGYVSYHDSIFELGLLAEGGVIFVDNTSCSGYAWEEHSSLISNDNRRDPTPIKRYNEHAKNDHRVDTVLLPINDGVTIVKRKD